jgi:ABC-type glycerol-3-phosphate transport system permease component
MKQGARWSASIAAVPVLVTYLFLRRQITDGVTAGSAKG